MKQFTMTFDVDDDFEPGCCYDCPLSYEEYSESIYDDEFGDYHKYCVLHCSYDECPITEGDIK